MTIRDELTALIRDGGSLNPHEVVDWARGNPDSALHRSLEWDDEKAAEHYRVWQARRLIAIHVVSADGERTTISLMPDRFSGTGYRPVDRVMSNADLRAMALQQAVEELRRWEHRYRHLTELAQVFAALDQAERRVSGNKAA